MAVAPLPRSASESEFDVMVLDKKLDVLRAELMYAVAHDLLLEAEEKRRQINRVLDRRLVAMRGEAA